jgi:hypothetical protein
VELEVPANLAPERSAIGGEGQIGWKYWHKLAEQIKFRQFNKTSKADDKENQIWGLEPREYQRLKFQAVR